MSCSQIRCVAIAAFASMVSIPATMTSAAIETWTVPAQASLPGNSGSMPFTVFLPTFSTNNGARVLTGVELSGEVTFFSQARVQNLSFDLASATVQFAAGVDILAPGAALGAFAPDSQSVTDLLPLEIHQFNDFVLSRSLGVQNPGTLASYATPFPGSLPLDGLFQAGITLSPNTALQWNIFPPAMGGSVTVVYTYEVVPAPGAAAVLGLLGGFACRRRR